MGKIKRFNGTEKELDELLDRVSKKGHEAVTPDTIYTAFFVASITNVNDNDQPCEQLLMTHPDKTSYTPVAIENIGDMVNDGWHIAVFTLPRFDKLVNSNTGGVSALIVSTDTAVLLDALNTFRTDQTGITITDDDGNERPANQPDALTDKQFDTLVTAMQAAVKLAEGGGDPDSNYKGGVLGFLVGLREAAMGSHDGIGGLSDLFGENVINPLFEEDDFSDENPPDDPDTSAFTDFVATLFYD